jgi:hypothetical protein
MEEKACFSYNSRMANDAHEAPKGERLEGYVELSEGILPPSVKGMIAGTREKAKWVLESSLTPRQLVRLQELQRRIDAGEILPMRMDLNELDMIMNQGGEPLTRGALKNQPVVLYPDEFEQLVALDIILANGEQILVEPESLPKDDVLVILPSELGEKEPSAEPEAEQSARVAAEAAALSLPFEDIDATIVTIHAVIANTLRLELPVNTRWKEIVEKHGSLPAETIRIGRKHQVPEQYLRQYALVIIDEEMHRRQWGFLVRFVENNKIEVPSEWLDAFKRFKAKEET